MKTEAAMQRLLAAVPLFHELTRDELSTFLALCHQEEVPAGYVVIEEGERGRHMFAVMSGKLKVTRRAENNEQIWLADIMAGDVFGELALVDYGERSASVTVIDPCRLLRFDRMDVIKLPPTLVAKLYRNVGNSMAHRLRQISGVATILLAEKQGAEAAPAAGDASANGFSAPEQRVVIRR
jgi:CRP-like cAMP-binding protein